MAGNEGVGGMGEEPNIRDEKSGEHPENHRADFAAVWGRIKATTLLNTFDDLALVAGTTQQNVSGWKKKNVFPIAWAFRVAQKYGLLTEWVVTGCGPARMPPTTQAVGLPASAAIPLTPDDFFTVWSRIVAETSIRTLIHLAEVVETSHPTVSRKKKENSFPVEWAFKIARTFALNTDWLMTGEGPKHWREGGGLQEEVFQGSLAEWIREQCLAKPDFYREFMADCAALFPRYAEWLRNRKAREEEKP